MVITKMTTFNIWKRLFDIVFGLFVLVLTLPVMLMIGVIILINDGGPVLFKQKRVGKNGRLFDIFKFRTMCKDATKMLKVDPIIRKKYLENNYKLPEGEDPRITTVGAFLRKTSLDELPQFWNVLKGDMSVVGPRPVVTGELEEYGGHKRVFLSMKPGVTGIWQVNGRSSVGYPERVGLELSYLEKQGLLYDIKIVFQTIWAVLKRLNAH